MPGLDPGINVDHRVKPGDDEFESTRRMLPPGFSLVMLAAFLKMP